MMPPKDELGYFVDEVMRDATTQREALTRVGLLYHAGWQTVRRWLVVYDMSLPFATGPRNKESK
jgi:hypothetical protein